MKEQGDRVSGRPVPYPTIFNCLHEHPEQCAHAESHEVSDGTAEDTHEYADTCVGGVICSRDDRGGCGTTDAGYRSGRAHAEIPVEELRQEEHENDVYSDDAKAINYPHRSGEEVDEGRGRSQHGDDGVEV